LKIVMVVVGLGEKALRRAPNVTFNVGRMGLHMDQNTIELTAFGSAPIIIIYA